MRKGKRRELSRGNSKPPTREIWVNSCGLTHGQVSNAVGKVIDKKEDNNGSQLFLVRTLCQSPQDILIQEGRRIYLKFN